MPGWYQARATSKQRDSLRLFHKNFNFRDIERSKSLIAEDLVLDTTIRGWVLIPLSVVMVLIGVRRYFVSKLMKSTQVPDAKVIKEGQIVIRARNLRASANFISKHRY